MNTSGNEENAHLLFDSAANCFPDDKLYFRTSEELLPYIRIDFGQPRIVNGVTIYLREDIDSGITKKLLGHCKSL